MDWDEVRPKQQQAAMTIGADLTNVSIEELALRIAALKAEIVRVEAELAAKRVRASAADQLFKL